MIAANVHSSQLENVEASTVVNVKGRKVREYSWCFVKYFQDVCVFFLFERIFLICLKYFSRYFFSLILKLQPMSKVGIIGYVTEQTPQKSQPGPETTFLPIIQSIRWHYKALLCFAFSDMTRVGTKHGDWKGEGLKSWSRWAMQVMVLVMVIDMVRSLSWLLVMAIVMVIVIVMAKVMVIHYLYSQSRCLITSTCCNLNVPGQPVECRLSRGWPADGGRGEK